MNSNIDKGEVPRKATVGDVMTRAVITVPPEATFREMTELMQRHEVSALPVVDGSGALIGMISEADLLPRSRAAAGNGRRQLFKPGPVHIDAGGVNAREVMTTPVVTVASHTPVALAARMMRDRDVKRLPVLDGGALVGIVSRRDLLTVFTRPDADIERDIVEGVIVHWMWMDPARITVRVEDGVVTLQGDVEHRSQIDLLVRFVSGLDGVVAVRQELGYQLDDTHVPPVGEARIR